MIETAKVRRRSPNRGEESRGCGYYEMKDSKEDRALPEEPETDFVFSAGFSRHLFPLVVLCMAPNKSWQNLKIPSKIDRQSVETTRQERQSVFRARRDLPGHHHWSAATWRIGGMQV